MKKHVPFFAILLILATASNAQSVAINADGSAASPSAMLDVKSNGKGVLLPRFTKANRDIKILAPVAGLIIYQTDNTPGFYYYDGSAWKPLQDQLGAHIMTQNLATSNFFISALGTGTGLQVKDSGRINIVGLNSVGDGIAQMGSIDPNGGFYLKGKSLAGPIPASGTGARMMWYPAKEAFRAGWVAGSQWDDNNIGDFSFAIGNSCISSNISTFSGGDGSTASGVLSFAYGSNNTSSGTVSTTLGGNNYAPGYAATAIGFNCRAIGQGSVALGYQSAATNDFDVALGYRATSNGYFGCMVMGDISTTDSVRNTANNQLAARYAGGYKLYSNSTSTLGVTLAASGNSWSTISDSSKKENFAAVNQEAFLDKLTHLKLGSWNYKKQSPENYRHYGPMAQEIFAAYGKDIYGKIGCDTLLASADMDGIMMIMLQGLEKRTAVEREENSLLKIEVNTVTAALNDLKVENDKLKSQLARLDRLEAQLLSLQQDANQRDAESNQLANAGKGK